MGWVGSGGLVRVCATEMYRSIGHEEFPKSQTGIFVEWKATLVSETFPSELVKNKRTRYESNLGAVFMIRLAGLPYNNKFVFTIRHFRNEKETGPS